MKSGSNSLRAGHFDLRKGLRCISGFKERVDGSVRSHRAENTTLKSGKHSRTLI